MGLFRKQDAPVDLEILRDIADDVIESDFVPYACLYDEGTILSKNGQLIQIIKISGLNYDTAHGNAMPLRKAIRAAISDTIPSSDYAIWLHTMRRRVKLTPQGDFPDAFSRKVHEGWKDVQQWDNAFINEVYISIVKEHQPIKLKDPVILWRSLRAKPVNEYRASYLDDAGKELTKTVDNFCKKLNLFSASRMGLIERDGVYYHEGVEFLEKLINLKYRPMPADKVDLSVALTSGDITFGYNAMEVRTAEGQRRFAAILTIKEYKEASLHALDQFLEIPCEVIISQCFDFVGAQNAKDKYELQHRYLRAGGDKDMIAMSEISAVIESGRTDIRDFGEHQITMFIIAPSVKELEGNIRMVRRALSRIGIVSIREDMMLENCYWAQLPGNLAFISRMLPINTSHLAGFISLQSLPMGNAVGSIWGPPVSLFPTISNTPYFFNFHREQVGHTTLIGPEGAGKTTLLHFLIAQARKLNARIWYIDTRGKTDIWARAIGADYVKIAPDSHEVTLSPLHAKDTIEHRDFLAVWLTSLIDASGKQITRSVVQYFRALVDQMYALAPEQRSLSALAQQVAGADMMLASALTRWVGSNAYGNVFDNKQETLKLGDFTVLDINAYMQDEVARAPICTYLLHQMTQELDGKPTIIVLDEAWLQLGNPLFAARVGDWLDHVSASNAMVLMTTQQVEASVAFSFARTLSEKAATQLFLPNAEPLPEYMTVFGLSEQEYQLVAQIRSSERHVLVKRGFESAIIKANLSPLGDIVYALANTTPPIAEQILTAEQQLAALMGWKGSSGNAA